MKIVIKNLQKKIPINLKKLKLAVLDVLHLQGVKKSGEITILFIDDKQIRELNLMYLGKDSPTDVISFDYTTKRKLHPGGEIFADIAISTDQAYRNAKIFKTTALYELYLYIIHGLLHILGYDDRNTKQRKIMQKKEKEVLTCLYTEPKQYF